MNCALIDDDVFSRKSIRLLCNKIDSLNVVAEYSSALEAIEGLRDTNNVDVIFLDIHMPELSGFDFLEALKEVPHIVFTTSDPSRALDAFNADATDYLVKPVALPRFLKAIEKLTPASRDTSSNDNSEYEKMIYVNVDRKLTRINTEEITVLEAKGDYVLIKTDNDLRYVVRSTLKKITNSLCPALFFKVHRSFVVNLSKVKDIVDNTILMGEEVIPISRGLKNDLVDQLNTL